MKESAIRIINLSFKYDNWYVFRDFNLNIEKGSFVTIIGKNGSGKSTLGNILRGYLFYNGNILINNNDIKVIMDEYDVDEKDTTIRKDLIRKFKLDKILNNDYINLEREDRLKIRIAKALTEGKSILYLDEVCDGLRRKDKEFIFRVLREYIDKDNLTVIVSTNDLEDTLVSDKIIIIDSGKVILEGKKEDIYKDEKLEKLGFEMPFIVKLSHNLMLYGLLDKVYFSDDEVIDRLWN